MSTLRSNDDQLVRAVLRGDATEYEEIVRRHLPAVRAIAIAHLPRHIQPDDVVQEAFTKAYEKLPSLRDPAKFGSWILTIARNAAHRVRANSRLATRTITDPDALPDVASASRPDPLLRDELAKLNESAREVILLHYYSGYSTPEIASLLSLNDAAVRKRLQRAREELGRQLTRGVESARPSAESTRGRAKHISGVVLANATFSRLTAPVPAAFRALLPRPAIWIAATIGGMLTLAGVFVLLRSSEQQPVLADATNYITIAQDPNEPALAIPPVRSDTDTEEHVAETEPSADAASDRGMNSDEAADVELTASVEERLRAPMSLQFENVHIAEVLDFIAEKTEVDFLLDLRAVGGPSAERLVDTVNPRSVPDMRQDGFLAHVNIPNLTVLDAADLVASEMGLVLVEEPGLLWMSTGDLVNRDGYRFADERFIEYDLAETYLERVQLEFEDIHVREILEFISDAHSVNVEIDSRVVRPPDALQELPALPPGKRTHGRIPYVNARNVQLRDLLRTIVRQVSLQYTPVAEYVWISASGVPPPTEPAESNRLDELLTRRVGAVFEDIDVLEILQFLSDAYAVPIVLDQRVVAWDAEPATAVNLWREEAGGFTHEPITHGMLRRVDVDDLAVATVLDIYLAQLGLEYRVDDGRVWASSPTLMTTRHTRHAWHATPEEVVELIKLKGQGDTSEADALSRSASEPSPSESAIEPKVLRLHQDASGEWRAQLDTGRSVTWVNTGDAVEQYRVVRITREGVFLEDEATNETWHLRLE